MNKYDRNLDSWTNFILPTISLIGFMVITFVVLYNCYINGVSGTCVTGW